MTTYAHGTLVSTVASRAEIERTLKRFGAEDVLCLEWHGKAEVFTPKGRKPRHPERALEQETRERWRALLVSVKGRMSSIEAGIETFEVAFMSHILLPNGQTVSEWALPQVEMAYQSGEMPPMLFLPGGNA
jgi:hypothetical protein